MDAQIRVGGDAGASEVIVTRLYGELADHGDAIVVPLLLPDAPVVAWWPQDAPDVPAEDPIGALAQRRITDSARHKRPLVALERRLAGLPAGRHRPGLDPADHLARSARRRPRPAAAGEGHLGHGRRCRRLGVGGPARRLVGPATALPGPAAQGRDRRLRPALGGVAPASRASSRWSGRSPAPRRSRRPGSPTAMSRCPAAPCATASPRNCAAWTPTRCTPTCWARGSPWWRRTSRRRRGPASQGAARQPVLQPRQLRPRQLRPRRLRPRQLRPSQLRPRRLRLRPVRPRPPPQGQRARRSPHRSQPHRRPLLHHPRRAGGGPPPRPRTGRAPEPLMVQILPKSRCHRRFR